VLEFHSLSQQPGASVSLYGVGIGIGIGIGIGPSSFRDFRKSGGDGGLEDLPCLEFNSAMLIPNWVSTET